LLFFYFHKFGVVAQSGRAPPLHTLTRWIVKSSEEGASGSKLEKSPLVLAVESPDDSILLSLITQCSTADGQ